MQNCYNDNDHDDDGGDLQPHGTVAIDDDFDDYDKL